MCRHYSDYNGSQNRAAYHYVILGNFEQIIGAYVDRFEGNDNMQCADILIEAADGLRYKFLPMVATSIANINRAPSVKIKYPNDGSISQAIERGKEENITAITVTLVKTYAGPQYKFSKEIDISGIM